MKFEKISEKEFTKYLHKNKPVLLSDSQLRSDIEYFTTRMPVPKRSTSGSAGYDFVCPITVLIPAHSSAKVPTGIKVKLDDDKFLAMYIRSGYATKHQLELQNQVSIIDSDYYGNEKNEGHIIEYVKNNSDESVVIERGSRFCQGIIQQFFVVETDDYGQGKKRTGGFGSTGIETKDTVVAKEDSNKEETTDAEGSKDTEIDEVHGGTTGEEQTAVNDPEPSAEPEQSTVEDIPEPQKEVKITNHKRSKEEIKRNLKKHMKH